MWLWKYPALIEICVAEEKSIHLGKVQRSCVCRCRCLRCGCRQAGLVGYVAVEVGIGINLSVGELRVGKLRVDGCIHS